MKKYSLSLLFLLTCSTCSFAQDGILNLIEKKGHRSRVVEMLVRKNSIYTNLDPEFKATGVSIQLLDSLKPHNAYLFLGEQEKFVIRIKDRQEQGDSIQVSELMLASQPFRYLSFFSGRYEGTIRFLLQYDKSKVSKSNP